MTKPRHDLTAGRFLGLAVIFALWSFVLAALCCFVGETPTPLRRGLLALAGRATGEADVTAAVILTQLRIPRVAMAFLAGGALAVAGAAFQALLRNPLATPHTLGVSSGGALGAVIAIALGWTHVRLGVFGPVQIFSLCGSLGAIGLIYLLAQQRERFSTFKLLLAGVTLGLICSAVIMFVRYMADPHKLVIMDRWLMGGLSVRGYKSLASVLPLFLPATVLLFCQANNLNQLAFGEELAVGRGINVRQVQVWSFIAGSVLTASVVSVAGPIGFVGLLIPHAFRFMLGPDHRVLLLASFFGGGAFLTVADTVARTAVAPTQLPVGVLTAMMGGPFFLILLVKRTRL